MIKISKIILVSMVALAFAFTGCGGDDESEESGLEVTYRAGIDNTGGSVPVDKKRYQPGDTVTILGDTGRLRGPAIISGIKQRFLLWNTREDGSGYHGVPGETFVINEDTVLYATYTVDGSVIKKIGPSGGWVFYDAGSVQPWGRYIEAATEDVGDGDWGLIGGWDPGTANDQEIGRGKVATNAILFYGRTYNKDISNSAALKCESYSVSYAGTTYGDWHLPSRWELEEMKVLVSDSSLATYLLKEEYWSSSLGGVHENAVSGNFDRSAINFTAQSIKSEIFHVRPVRYF